MDQKQKDVPIPTTDKPSLSRKVIAPMRKCKVVLEDISIHSVTGKHNMLKQCQGNPQSTPSCDTVEKKSLQDLTVKRPISRGHCNILPKRNLAGKTPCTLQSIHLIKQKNLLHNQISSTVDPKEQASLRELLAPTKDKIRNFCCAEKHRKRWLFKKQQKFHKNPY